MALLPLVTVGVASYNNATFLSETLDSILAQTYKNIEIIIVDDCSKDNSVQIARDWIDRHPNTNVRLIANATNQGVCKVLNLVVEVSNGEFISTIGSDDIFLPHKLATQVPLLMASKPDVCMVFSDISKIDAAGHVTVPSLFSTGSIFPFSGYIWLELLKVNFIPAMSILVRKRCYQSIGLFDESLAYEDWDMWLRLARTFKFIYQPEVTARYRIHSGSATFSRRIQMAKSSLKLVHKHQGYSPDGDRLIAAHTRHFAESLYQLGSPRARQWLWQAVKQNPDATTAGLLVVALLGIPAGQIGRLKGWAKGLLGAKQN